MARSHDDYEDYDDHGGSGSKGSKSSYRFDSSSVSSHRENFGKTSSFSTMLSDDGRFFGISLSPETKSQLEKIYPIALPIITEKAELAATKLMGHGTLSNAVGWGIALSEQIYKVGENLYTSTKSANDLRVAMQPLARANSQAHQIAPLSGTNEVIANARGKISSVFWQRMVDTAVSTIGAAPAILMKVNQHAKGNAAANLQKEMEEAATDINKLKELQENRLNGTALKNGEKSKMPSAKSLRAANALIVEEREAEYIAKYKKFAETRKAAMTKELEEALAITQDNIGFKAKELEKFGISAEPLKDRLKGKEVRDKTTGQYYREEWSPDEAKEIIDKFIANVKGTVTPAKKGTKSATTTSRSMDRYVDDAMRYEFGRKEGAWDENWRPVSERRSSDKEDPYLKKQLEAEFSKLAEENRKIESEMLAAEKGAGKGAKEESKMREVTNALWGVGASITREIAGKVFGGNAHEQYKKPLALDRILHLRRSVEQPKDKPDWTPPDEVPPIPSDSRKSESKEKSMSYTQFVHEIFQQHQRDSKRVEIGDRFFQNFEKARWNDEKINQIPDDQLSAYELAVKTIAKRIKDGRMDALALVELVGDPTRKIVQNDGRTFGPQGTGKDEKEAKEAILKLIDEKSAILHTVQVKTEEQVNDKLSNFVFSVDDMKKALETDTLDKEQRAFVFTMFSDVVGSDEKLCQKLGISTERCVELRKESQEYMNQTLDSVVAVLAEVIEKSPEAVQKNLNITDKEKTLIKNLARQEVQEGKHAVDLTKDREEMERLKTISANATMMLAGNTALEGEGKPSFWQRVKDKIEEFKNPKPKAEAKPEKRSSMDDAEFDKPKAKPSASSRASRDMHDDFADDFDKPSKPKSSSYKSHDPFEHDDAFDMGSRKSKPGKHSDLDHDMDYDRGGRFADREDSRHPERAGTSGRYADRFASKHSDKGEHGKKWTDDHKRDDDDFGGRVRRNRLESESETASRGGIV